LPRRSTIAAEGYALVAGSPKSRPARAADALDHRRPMRRLSPWAVGLAGAAHHLEGAEAIGRRQDDLGTPVSR
jgi:hypothetical protein